MYLVSICASVTPIGGVQGEKYGQGETVARLGVVLAPVGRR